MLQPGKDSTTACPFTTGRFNLNGDIPVQLVRVTDSIARNYGSDRTGPGK